MSNQLNLQFAEKVKKFVTQSHVSLLQLSSLIIMAFVWFIVYNEGSLLASYESMAFGTEHTGWLTFRKAMIGFIGSICAMVAPVFAPAPRGAPRRLVWRSRRRWRARRRPWRWWRRPRHLWWRWRWIWRALMHEVSREPLVVRGSRAAVRKVATTTLR